MHVPCRDIKPENLLLFHPDGAPDGPEGLILKVVDYGCSTFCVPGKRLCKKFGTVSLALWPLLCLCGRTALWPVLCRRGRS
jgi:serine/threonine protein kinase